MPHDVDRKPLIPRKRLMVALTDEVDYELRCAREFGLGVEVQSFAMPSMLGRDYAAPLTRMVKRVSGIKGPIGCHGAFLDTVHFSLDPEIRRVARTRYLEGLDIAEAVGAGYVLFHSQYNPVIKIPDYGDIYHYESLKFWPEILEEAERRGIAVYLENMFDDSPEPMRRLLDAIDSPRLGLCFDMSHADVFSNLPAAEWVAVFGPHLRHVHMNDCRGEFDDHLGLGQGALNVRGTLAALKKTGLPITYALETARFTRQSLRFLGISKADPSVRK